MEELKAIGVADAEIDENGYVYGTIPANTDKKVPVLRFCSHMDTSPDCSGEGVKPIVHAHYKRTGPGVARRQIRGYCMSEHEDLKHQIGNDIITASGTTLLGADNKAGVAAIMDAAQIWLTDKSLKHGKIRILFTPDEEIGRGVDKVNMKKLGARFGYTIDGETAGSIEDETFSARRRYSHHPRHFRPPGFCQRQNGKCAENCAHRGQISRQTQPRTHGGQQGFIHPVHFEGNIEKATVKLIIRDFTESGLKRHAKTLQKIVDGVLKGFLQIPAPRSKS